LPAASQINVTFSQRGQYNPALEMEAIHSITEWRRMTVVNSDISPLPREADPPYAPITFNDTGTTVLDAGAFYTYEADTLYRFTADLVPDFAVYNIAKTKTCIAYQQYATPPSHTPRSNVC
jgi:hypothetical protein